MRLTNAVTVVIPSPFPRTVTDCRMRTDAVLVTLPFVGVHLDTHLGEGMDMTAQVSRSVCCTMRKRTRPLSHPTVPTMGGRSFS